MTRRPEDDSGAALVLALAFITIVAIGTTALLTLADTGQRTTAAIRDQGFELYSASGAVDRAITDVRQDTSQGKESGPCPTVVQELNGVSTTVTCSGAPGSGAGVGGGANATNTPPNAVLTLAAGSEEGLVQQSNNELRINGAVLSNSTITANAAGATLQVAGTIDARGACSASVTAVPGPRRCDLGPTAAIADSGDKGYDLHPAAPPVTPPAAAPAPVGCVNTGDKVLVKFSPGTYTSAAALNAVFTKCEGSVFWFEPGFYYFDFTDGTPVWNVTGSASNLVGGEPVRWQPMTLVPGDPRPTVPFPADVTPPSSTEPAGTPQALGACVTSQEVATTPGVQFAFGHTSRMRVQDAKVELCARGSTSSQQIALYGLPPAKDTTIPVVVPAQQTVTMTQIGAATTSGTPLFTSPDNGRGFDSQYATATGISNQAGTARLTVPGFSAASIPAGSTIDSVKLRLVHQPENSNVEALKATLVNSSGTDIGSVGDTQAPTGCGTSQSAICKRATAAPYDQTILLTGVFTPQNLQASTLRFDATVKTGQNGPAGVEKVDGVSLIVAYTPPTPAVVPPYRKLDGCNVLPLSAGGCPLIESVGGPTAISVHGTAYAPTGALRLELTSVGSSVLERGLIARSAYITVTGSSGFTGSAVALPPLASAAANRVVEFVAVQGSRTVLRARVRFDDLGLLGPGKRADVQAWHVLR